MKHIILFGRNPFGNGFDPVISETRREHLDRFRQDPRLVLGKCENDRPLGTSVEASWRRMRMAIDPVCKMEVDEKKAAATSEYKGKKYYFCAPGCKKSFDQNPEKYLGSAKK